MRRRAFKILLGAFVLWTVALVVGGFVMEGRTTRSVRDRIGEALKGDVTIGDSDLALLRGGLALEQLVVRRDDLIGKLTLEVAEVSCDLWPLGIALFDRACGELAIEGMRLELSTTALFQIQRPKRKPIRADRVVVEDATLVFMPNALLPSLGQIRIQVDRAVAGPTTFRTPLSFVLALRELRATLDLPAGVTVHLTYANGVLGASGSLFGSTPVTLPVSLPLAEASDDAQAELKKLLAFGRELAERLVAQRATDLWRKLAP